MKARKGTGRRSRLRAYHPTAMNVEHFKDKDARDARCRELRNKTVRPEGLCKWSVAHALPEGSTWFLAFR